MQAVKEDMKAKFYEDADLISWKLSNKPYEYASRTGDFVVHYSKDNEPVMVEILNASKFLKETNGLLPKRIQQEVLPMNPYTSVAHRIK